MQIICLAIFCFLTFHAQAQSIGGTKLGGFIDTYYAYDFNNPKDHERAYTTQPVRHNEFNVNLAFIEAVLQRKNTRGKLALQYGQSVTKNASAEPTEGETSGPSDSKFIQEAFVGTKLGENTWIDLGIFLGHLGSESWISIDNWTYTRALFSDYAPYFQSGARLDHRLDQNQNLQLWLLNGWGNISENNQGKALGLQYKNTVNQNFTFIYNNFFGDEEIYPDRPRTRSYHNFIFTWLASDEWNFLYGFDIGHQSQQENTGVDAWYATALTVRYILNPDQALAFRTEYYNDRHEANVVTNTRNGFQVTGASLGFDQKLEENAMWRTELRGFHSKDEVYPAGRNSTNRMDGFLVTSLSLSF